MNKTLFWAFLSLLISTNLTAQTSKKRTLVSLEYPLSIIPKPAKLVAVSGSFNITNKTVIYVENEDARLVAKFLNDKLKIGGINPNIIGLNEAKTNDNVIFILKSDDKALGTEGYRLSVSSNQINIRANTGAGMFYAIQSLLQIFPADIYSPTPLKKKDAWVVPCIDVEDKPRYSYRGLHLDAGRHFQPISFVKKYIDLMAMHKMNKFHWHLTEDQGWRIEIKKYPKLTEIGSKRKETIIGHNNDSPQKFDGTPYGGFYTQEQIKEVVAYAQERFVTIIPEIEMPGHALAALAAYPELSCDPSKKYEVGTKWGVYDDVFCPTEKTFGFLEDVLTEVIALFPSKYIHIGGDECPKDAWKKSAFCQDLIKKEGLKDEHELQSYFIRRIEKFLNSKGRSIIGWDEILEGGLAPNATVMSWRGIEGGIEAAKQNHDVVMSPGSFCYLDSYQADPETEPLAIGGLLNLETAYSYEPTPEALNNEQAQRILGAQGNVWTEYIKTTDYLEYMAFPRALALAEVNWTPKSGRNYENFVSRLALHFKKLDVLKVNYATRVFDVKQVLKSEKLTPQSNELKTTVELSTIAENSEIRYTMDGTVPKSSSFSYSKPIEISKATTIKAAPFQNGKIIGKPTTQTFYINSAFGLKYSLAKPAKNTYESGEFGLTNGVKGSEKNYAQWTGFQGNDMEMTLDFGAPRSFSKVFIQFLNRPESWIFLPDYVILSVSNDGKDWLDINRSDFSHSRGETRYIREAKLQFSEYTKPKRYLKVFAKNMGKCPKGHVGEGQAAWLFADEIIVE